MMTRVQAGTRGLFFKMQMRQDPKSLKSHGFSPPCFWEPVIIFILKMEKFEGLGEEES